MALHQTVFLANSTTTLMNAIQKSPFVFGRPLQPDEPHAVSNDSAIADTLRDSRMASGEHWVFLGDPRTGTTSAIRRHLIGGSYPLMRIQLTDVMSARDAFDLTAAVASSLLRDVWGRSGSKPPPPYLEARNRLEVVEGKADKYPASECCRDLVTEVLRTMATWIPLVVWYDGAGDLLRDPDAAHAVLSAASHGKGHRVNFFWSGLRRDDVERLEAVLGKTVHVVLAPPSPVDLIAHVRARFEEGGRNVPHAVLDQAVALFPNPDELNRFAHLLWARSGATVSDVEFQAALFDAAADGDRRLVAYFTNGTALQRRALTAYALLQGRPLAERICVEWAGARFPSSLQKAMRSMLKHTDPIIRRGEDGAVTITDGFARVALLRRWACNPSLVPAYVESAVSASTAAAVRVLGRSDLSTPR